MHHGEDATHNDGMLTELFVEIDDFCKEFEPKLKALEPTRHRSPHNFFVNLLAGLVAYSRLPKKPSIRFDCHEELDKELLMLT